MDNSGVFMINVDPLNPRNGKQVCIYLRKENGAHSEFCIADHGNTFQIFGMLIVIFSSKPIDNDYLQVRLDEMSLDKTVLTNTLDNEVIFHGFHKGNNSAIRFSMKEIVINLNDPLMATLKFGKFLFQFSGGCGLSFSYGKIRVTRTQNGPGGPSCLEWGLPTGIMATWCCDGVLSQKNPIISRLEFNLWTSVPLWWANAPSRKFSLCHNCSRIFAWQKMTSDGHIIWLITKIDFVGLISGMSPPGPL